MIVIVTGGRNYKNKDLVYKTLDGLLEEFGHVILYHGAASGADELASRWADDRDILQIKNYADWERHGRAAGPIRNREMVEAAKGYWNAPCMMVAFPGGKGTADAIKVGKKHGLEVRIVEDEDII